MTRAANMPDRRRLAALLLGALLAGCAALPARQDAASQPSAGATARAASGSAPEIATGWTPKRIARSTGDLVVAAHPLAAQAGAQVLARGGSAVDAAIAAQMVLNVVEPQSSGIGGGGFLLHLDGASGALAAYDGRETAPAAATGDLFLGPDGRPLPFFDLVDSGLSVGTPGLLRMLEAAHARHGRLAWPALFEPAIRLAEEGFEISPRLHRSIAASAPRICASPAAAALFLEPGGCQARAAGSLLRNPALAQTFRSIAADGAHAFYRGPLARAIVAAVRAHPLRPGRLSEADLETYRARERSPVCGPYRGYRICGMPPPSSGGIAVLQTLGVLERFDLRALQPGSADAVHLVSEAHRLAYADRARHVADDDFVPVPVAGLLDPGYLAQRAALIRPGTSMGVPAAGQPAGAQEHGHEAPRSGPPSTTHLSIVDRDGNAVSMTTSIEHAFGSLRMAGGFLLNNQLTDFAFVPVDAAGRPLANRIEPGKRPRSSMAPTLVIGPDGRLAAALGSPGGSVIIHYVTKTLLGLLDWGLDIQQAIDLPNFGAQASAVTLLERGTALESLAPALRERGHRVAVVDLNSGLHGIAREGFAPEAAGREGVAGGAGDGASRGAGDRTAPSGPNVKPMPAGAAAQWTGGADPRREGVARGSDR
ncbi:MAG TPA: gamma-glutamyltransferase [Quisquiliibacterium sp.]|nr:gamma-glutamyltransferase [Quisquiliibacterium sp.]